MPVFHQQNIDNTTKLGIWKIEEDEHFFLLKVPLQQNITHPHKRLQHLAGRYLLQFLFPDFPYEEIIIADTRKPFLPNEQYHFSISHCGQYAAAIVSSTNRVGIDIEIPTEKAQRIAHKFIHESEKQWMKETQLLFSGETNQFVLETILWSAKESLFKWYSLGEVDFKQHMQLYANIKSQNKNLILPFIFKKQQPIYLNIISKIFDDLVLSYITTQA